MKAFAEAWGLSSGLDGWLSEKQGRTLFELAHALPAGRSIVEIGSHQGRSTILLAAGAATGVELLAVDPFDDPRWGGGGESLKAFERNVRAAGVEDRVVTFRGTSGEAGRSWSGAPIGLLFVDGAHDLESVLLDIDVWEPHLATDGAVCFHDAFSSPGVTLALMKRHLFSRRFTYARSAGSLSVFVRRDTGVFRAAWSSARMLGRLVYFARNLAIKLAIRRNIPAVPALLGHRGGSYPY